MISDRHSLKAPIDRALRKHYLTERFTESGREAVLSSIILEIEAEFGQVMKVVEKKPGRYPDGLGDRTRLVTDWKKVK